MHGAIADMLHVGGNIYVTGQWRILKLIILEIMKEGKKSKVFVEEEQNSERENAGLCNSFLELFFFFFGGGF